MLIVISWCKFLTLRLMTVGIYSKIIILIIDYNNVSLVVSFGFRLLFTTIIAQIL